MKREDWQALFTGILFIGVVMAVCRLCWIVLSGVVQLAKHLPLEQKSVVRIDPPLQGCEIHVDVYSTFNREAAGSNPVASILWYNCYTMDKLKYNEYMRKYQLEKYRRRRQFALDKLGNKCAKCSSKENLEIDHIDKSSKSFNIAKSWSVSEKRFISELNKCQLLCQSCHITKSILESGKKVARGNHGTISTYRYCKCDLCRKAKRDYGREYRKRKKHVN